MRDNEHSFWTAIGLIAVFLVGVPLSAVFSGYALSIMWGWFVVPAFKIPALNIPQAIGIQLIIGYLTKQAEPETEEEKKRTAGQKLIVAIGTAILKPSFALFFGWIITKFL